MATALQLETATASAPQEAPATFDQTHQAAARVARLLTYIATHPGLQHLPQHTKAKPYPGLGDHVYHLPDRKVIVLEDRVTRPSAFPKGMDLLVAALGYTSTGLQQEYEHALNPTFVYAKVGETSSGIGVVRINPYDVITGQGNRSSNYLEMMNSGTDDWSVVLTKRAAIKGEYFVPFDMSRTTLGMWPLGVGGRLIQAETRAGNMAVQDSSNQEYVTGVLQGVEAFLEAYIPKNMKTGWAHLPSVSR